MKKAVLIIFSLCLLFFFYGCHGGYGGSYQYGYPYSYYGYPNYPYYYDYPYSNGYFYSYPYFRNHERGGEEEEHERPEAPERGRMAPMPVPRAPERR
jgi:hypothetical protein